MRVLPLALAVACLAGCLGPTQSTTSTFERTCPAWITGLSTSMFEEGFGPNTTSLEHVDDLGRGLQADENRPLDIIVFDFQPRHSGNRTVPQYIYVQDGALTLTVQRSDDGSFLKIYDPAKGPRGLTNPGENYKVFVPGQLYHDFQLQVDLAESHDAPHPTPVTATWTFTPNSDNNPATPSQAAFVYTGQYMYRQC